MIHSQINALPLTENKSSAWRNKVAGSLNAQRVIAGPGIRVDYTLQGLVVSLDVVNDSLPIKYTGDFNQKYEYFPNQIVRVRPDQTYYDLDGITPLQIGSTADGGYETFPITPGLYICTNYVPPFNCEENWLNNVIAPLYPDGVPFETIQSTRWNDYNIYWPMYPEIPTKYTASIVVTAGNRVTNIKANQNFWNAMPCGMREMKTCANGVNKVTYITSFVSGSVFLPEYLPYNP